MPVTTQNKTALIVGATGIVGGNLARHLNLQGWKVFGLSRSPRANAGEMTPLAADLLDLPSLTHALADLQPDHVFISTWSRQPTEAENVAVNGQMIRNLFAALKGKSIQHVALITGTKQYLGPFESYGQVIAETPFREDSPRLPGLNFYYTQEDALFEASREMGFGWTVHRPHTIIGFAHGNAMNMGVSLAVYASLCRAKGEAFLFPGSIEQWNFLTDLTDVEQLSHQLEWASNTPSSWNQAFNSTNGDIFRWRWLWPQLAAYFGLESQAPSSTASPLDSRMQSAGDEWRKIAAANELVEPDIGSLVSWWHTDGDLGRKVECVNDMSKSRIFGFDRLQSTPESFVRFFDLLKELKIIPRF